MDNKKTLIIAAVIGLLLLGGCVATPYYGSAGYYRGASYGYQASPYYGSYGYTAPRSYGAPNYYIGGRINLHGGHKHGIGGHRHWGGGHQHFGGGHRGRGHGRHH